ncbi:cell filamentation protein Fic [Terrisporobacter glycolicus]|uniref:cell filamentation protein Fic n=1 Tax=Terrisporobacter glycolicus TaxID=36841 RepID=UPI000A7429B4
MEYTMGTKLANISVDMNNVKKLCKINEYKGEQIVYKKQPKNVVTSMTDDAILKFVYDTYIDSFLGGQENLVKLIHNEITPQSRDEIGVVEFRDVIKTINSAFEDIQICSQTILELHGYLHRYSLIRGGRYRNEAIGFIDFGKPNDDFNNVHDIEKNIEYKMESLCEKYYKFLEENKIQDLIIIASFIMDFMLISPFKEDNLAMSKILTLLLLNKSGYEIGRFTSLGNLYNDENYSYFKTLFSKQGDLERESYNMNKWLDYFLSFVLSSYEDLSEEMNLTGIKKETKTRRIEKVINSTLGYFTKDDVRNQCPDIPEPTINRVFNNLRKSGKIEVVAKGRSAKWKKK